jgi:hypothetical protein
MTDPTPCAAVSRALQEPLLGTASRVRSWLLIEHDAIWGRDAIAEDVLEDDVMQKLRPRLHRHKIRLILIRRPRGQSDPHRHCYLVHSGPERQWIQELDAEHPGFFLDIDFADVQRGFPSPVGSKRDGPLYLVCTHSEHDPCCATYGRPIADGLARVRAKQTWESSHVGGDRFAANVVCLPHGLYFGRVPADRSVNLVSLYENKRINLDHYRGRSCYDPMVQAADILIRRRERLDHIDDLVFESREDLSVGEATVAFRDRNENVLTIRLAARRAPPRHITCSTSKPGTPREYRPIISEN